MYKGCVRYLVMPHARHVCVLQPLVRPHVMHVHLGLDIVVSLNYRTTRIWSFGYSLACATARRCAGFRLSFGTIIAKKLLTIIK